MSLFLRRLRVALYRYPDNEACTFESVDDSFTITNADIVRLVECCNEDLIYAKLFSARLGGRAYTLNDAREFLENAKRAWVKGEYFVFLVRDANGKIVAVL